MASTPFKGALKGKRKPDLLEIASAIGAPIDDGARRDDVEAAIKNHLVANRTALESNNRFEGLYSSLDKSERRGRVSAGDSESDNGSPQTPQRSPRKTTHKTPRASNINGATQPVAVAEQVLVDATQQLGNTLKARTKKSLDNLTGAFRKSSVSSATTAVAHAPREAAAEASHAGQATVRRAKSFFRKNVETPYQHLFQQARTFASDAGNLTRLLIGIEAVVLVLSVLPTHYLRLGGQTPVQGFFRRQNPLEALTPNHSPLGSALNPPHWAITIPDVRGLVSLSFWQPILLWIAYLVALPSLAAHLITFQRKHEPSPITFAFVRLAVLLILTGAASQTASSSLLSTASAVADASGQVPNTFGVAAGQPSSGYTGSLAARIAGAGGSLVNTLSYTRNVPLDAGIQIVGTALVAGIAVYEALATRPRATA